MKLIGTSTARIALGIGIFYQVFTRSRCRGCDISDLRLSAVCQLHRYTHHDCCVYLSYEVYQ